jgi:hypothetical protein
MESMRKDPEKYSALIHYASNNASYSNQYYTSYFGNRNGEYSHQFSSFDSFLEALGSTILEEASKLYEQLLKEQVDTIIKIMSVIRICQCYLQLPTTNSQPLDISESS